MKLDSICNQKSSKPYLANGLVLKEYLAVLLLLIAWSTFFYMNGLVKLFQMLGGIFEFFVLIPILAILSINYSNFKKLIWGLVLALIGLIILNYLYTYLSQGDKEVNLFFLVYLIFLPAIFVPLGYGCVLSGIFVFRDNNARQTHQNTNILKGFLVFFISVFMTPLFLVLPVLANYGDFRNVSNLGIHAALIGLILGSCIFMIKIRKFCINVASSHSLRGKNSRAKFFKIKMIFMIALFLLILFSITSELEFRNHWLIWFETIIVFFLYLIFLIKMTPFIFVSDSSNNLSSNTKYLPSIRNKNNIILISSLVIMVLLFDIFIDLFLI